MIENSLVGDVSVTKVVAGGSVIYFVDTYCKLPSDYDIKCDETVSAEGFSLCYVKTSRQGCALVVLAAQSGERRSLELVGCEVADGSGMSAEEAASCCADAAKSLSCSAP